jgi:hypothetical protein
VKILIVGPNPGDRGDLIVKFDGSVEFASDKYGDLRGTGATFLAGRGLAIDNDISTSDGKKAHVKGRLDC